MHQICDTTLVDVSLLEISISSVQITLPSYLYLISQGKIRISLISVTSAASLVLLDLEWVGVMNLQNQRVLYMLSNGVLAIAASGPIISGQRRIKSVRHVIGVLIFYLTATITKSNFLIFQKEIPQVQLLQSIQSPLPKLSASSAVNKSITCYALLQHVLCVKFVMFANFACPFCIAPYLSLVSH